MKTEKCASGAVRLSQSGEEVISYKIKFAKLWQLKPQSSIDAQSEREKESNDE